MSQVMSRSRFFRTAAVSTNAPVFSSMLRPRSTTVEPSGELELRSSRRGAFLQAEELHAFQSHQRGEIGQRNAAHDVGLMRRVAAPDDADLAARISASFFAPLLDERLIGRQIRNFRRKISRLLLEDARNLAAAAQKNRRRRLLRGHRPTRRSPRRWRASAAAVWANKTACGSRSVLSATRHSE